MSDGCGKLALCASEENCSRQGSPCWPAGRVAVHLSGGGNSRLDGHDRDEALQGFATVREPKIFWLLSKPKPTLLIFWSPRTVASGCLMGRTRRRAPVVVRCARNHLLCGGFGYAHLRLLSPVAFELVLTASLTSRNLKGRARFPIPRYLNQKLQTPIELGGLRPGEERRVRQWPAQD